MALLTNGLNLAGDTIADRPASCVLNGQQFMDAATGNGYYWTGAAWGTVSGGAASAPINPTLQKNAEDLTVDTDYAITFVRKYCFTGTSKLTNHNIVRIID